MREWLLKDEKAKVGRPKLANEELLKKSKILISISLLLCVILTFSFVCTIKDMSFNELLGSVIGSNLDEIIKNKNGFVVEEYYNNNDYVMKIKVTDSVKRYSGSYKYTLYYLKDNKWIKYDSKEISKEENEFKIKYKSLKNENRTWKIKLQIVNSSRIEKSYAPYSWKFVDAEKMEDKYAYKVFTVKGYYSPVSLNEINESKKNKDKISVDTSKDDPRTFLLNVPSGNYDVNISYIDDSGKKTVLSNDKQISGTTKYKIPNFMYSVKVSVKVWVNSLSKKDLENIKLSTWILKEDKNKNAYITTTYVLKPELSYKN